MSFLCRIWLHCWHPVGRIYLTEIPMAHGPYAPPKVRKAYNKDLVCCRCGKKRTDTWLSVLFADEYDKPVDSPVKARA